MDSKQRIHVMTLANSIIGVSILAMPFCFKQCGIILSVALLLFSSILCRLACHFLLKSAMKVRLRTFEFLAYHVFGSVGKLFVEIGLIGFLLGTCIAFFVVMGDLGPQIIKEISHTRNFQALRTTILIALGLLCVLPLGLLRNVNSLSGVCLATIGFYGTLVLKIISESVPHLIASDWYENVDWWRPSGLLQCLPIFSMALFCQTQLFEIYQAIPNASLEKMNDVVKIAVNICTFVYIFVGVFGYIAISHKSNFSGNILMDFQPSIITEVMKIGFVLSLAFSFPLVIFPCRASLYSLLYRPVYTGLHDTSTVYIPEGKFRILTAAIVLVSLIIGVLIPNIELVLGLVGSTIGIMICVIFPATCFICLTDKNTNERILAQIMLVIGVAVMVLGTYANLYAIENISTTQISAIDTMASKGFNLNIDVKQISIAPPIIDGIQSKSQLLQEIHINLNDEVKEVRHEPPQPEEPQEPPPNPLNDIHKDNVQKEAKDSRRLNDFQLKQEVASQPEEPRVENKKESNVIEVDLDAIKKEDQELAKANDQQASANLVEHKKLVAQEQRIFEENKKLLEEIKQRQKETLLNKMNEEKVNAVNNIRQIAEKAIQSIVDDKLEDRMQLPGSITVEHQPIQSDGRKGKERFPQTEAHNQANVKAEPLSYQLGLQDRNNTLNMAKSAPKTETPAEVHQPENKLKLTIDDVLRAPMDKIMPSFKDIEAANDTDPQRNDPHADSHRAIDVSEKANKSVSSKQEAPKVDIGRDILSNDYTQK